VTDADDVRIMG